MVVIGVPVPFALSNICGLFKFVPLTVIVVASKLSQATISLIASSCGLGVIVTSNASLSVQPPTFAS